MFSWEVDYDSILDETDETVIKRRLCEAIAGIEHRLLSPLEAGSPEELALKDAQCVIAMMRGMLGSVIPICPLHKMLMRQSRSRNLNVQVCPKDASIASTRSADTSRLRLCRQSRE